MSDARSGAHTAEPGIRAKQMTCPFIVISGTGNRSGVIEDLSPYQAREGPVPRWDKPRCPPGEL